MRPRFPPLSSVSLREKMALAWVSLLLLVLPALSTALPGRRFTPLKNEEHPCLAENLRVRRIA